MVTLASVVLALLSPCTRSIAQDYLPADMVRDEASDLKEVTSSAKAQRIALERYRFIRRLESEHGFHFLSASTFQCYFAYFPFGRSDRVYILNYNDVWQRPNVTNRLFCFDWKDGKDRLVYSVRHYTDLEHNQKPRPKVNGLIDFIVPRGVISHSVMQDLTAQRAYTIYRWEWHHEALEVSTFSGGDSKAPSETTLYFPTLDPLIGTQLKPYGFYDKYGFPVSKQEAASFLANP